MRSLIPRNWLGMRLAAPKDLVARDLVPSVDGSFGLKLLPLVLSVIAGTTDVISFLGLGGLFTAHITGNLVILAAHFATGGAAPVAAMLSVPVFMMVLGLSRLLAGGLEAIGIATLRPLLLLQLLLLAGCLAVCAAGKSSRAPLVLREVGATETCSGG